MLCPGCGRDSDPGASYCAECRIPLYRGLRVSPEEARDIEAGRLAKARSRRILRWAVLAAVVLVVAAGATAYMTVGPGDFDPPMSSIGANPAPGDWPMYQGDPAHSGYVSEKLPTPDGRVEWQFRTNAPILAAPSVAQGKVYLSTGDGRIVALEAETGELVWEHEVTGPVNSSPAVAGDLVFVGLRDGRLLALDKSDGTLRWEFHTNDLIYGSPAAYRGVVYVGSGNRSLYALDALTGEVRWSRETGGRIVSAPAVRDEVVAAISQDQRIYIYDADKGGFRLDFLTRDTIGAPTLGDELAYVANTKGIVFAIDWKQRQLPFEKTARWIRTQLFFWGFVNSLPATKGFEWSFWRPGEIFRGTPALDDHRVYIASESGNIYALDHSDGTQSWKFEAEADIHGSPSLAGDTLYIADSEGVVYGLNTATGAEEWRFEVNDQVSSTIVAANDMLFVAADSGILYAIR